MSRSRKRIPMVKDAPDGMKAKANRKLRHAVKIAVNKGAEVLPVSEELTNQYDICDWKFLAYTPEQEIKYLRK